MAASFAFSSSALSPGRSLSLGCSTQFSQFTSTVGAPSNLNRFHDSGVSMPSKKIVLQATQDSINFFSSASLMSELDIDDVPMPIVMIDQDANPEATVVQIGFGDRLGALIDTMKALKDLGLNVVKGNVSSEGGVKQTKLHITIFVCKRRMLLRTLIKSLLDGKANQTTVRRLIDRMTREGFVEAISNCKLGCHVIHLNLAEMKLSELIETERILRSALERALT